MKSTTRKRSHFVHICAVWNKCPINLCYLILSLSMPATPTQHPFSLSIFSTFSCTKHPSNKAKLFKNGKETPSLSLVSIYAANQTQPKIATTTTKSTFTIFMYTKPNPEAKNILGYTPRLHFPPTFSKKEKTKKESLLRTRSDQSQVVQIPSH